MKIGDRTRLWMEIIGFVATVIGCLIAFYQVLGPMLISDDRKEFLTGLEAGLNQDGVAVGSLDPAQSGNEIGATIADAVEQVREVRNTFFLKANDSQQLTKHEIIFTNRGVRGSTGHPPFVAATIGGEPVLMEPGKGYPLPAPADTCMVQIVGMADWYTIWRQEAEDIAEFAVRCR